MSLSDVDTDLRLQIRQWQHDIKSPLSALEVIVERLKRQGAREADILEATLQRLRSLIPSVDQSQPQLLNKKSAYVVLPLAFKNLFLQKQIEYTSQSEVQFSFNSFLQSTSKVPVFSTDFQCIISNLINNSFEAIKGPGWVRVNLWQENSWVVIQVVDSGCGIPESLCKQVFECGFSYGKDSGSGLGLWQAYQVISRAGGKIKIDSQVQGGTTVQIKLPSLWEESVTGESKLDL